jgi:hypothetical protein
VFTKKPVIFSWLLLTLVLVSTHSNAASVTILIHGWHASSGVPWWPTAMQSAIAQQRLGGEEKFGTITVTGTTGNLTATCSPWNVNLDSSSSGEIVIVVDWHAVSDHLVSGVAAQEVAAIVAPKIYQAQGADRALAELPIHLIGHSRGGGMVCELARLLGEQGIEVDHLTPLDPHPLTASDPQPTPPIPSIIDTPVAVPENVLFADSYWQNITYPEGEYVTGAYNRLWTSLPGGYHNNTTYASIGDHLNVHLMYHGTIDLTTPTDDTEGILGSTERAAWFNTYETNGGVGGQNAGFIYSRLEGSGDRWSTDTPVAGGDQIVDGVHGDPLLGGNGARSTLGWSSAHWPNVITVDVSNTGNPLDAGSYSVVVGDTLSVRYTARDFDSTSTVTLYLDADLGPYNGNTILTIGSTGHSASGSSIFENTMAWDTSTVAPGTTGYVLVEITDGTDTRSIYASPKLRFTETPLFADGFESGTTDGWGG